MGVVRIAIVKSGTEYNLSLPSDFRMNVEDFNSAYSLDVAIRNGSSIGIRIPIEDNAEILDFAHELAVRNRVVSWEARVYEDEVPLFNGTLILNEVVDVYPDAFYDCDFINDNYAQVIQGKSIREVMDETVDIGADAAAIAASAAAINGSFWPDEIVCFPTIYNADQYGGNVTDFIGWLNRWNQDLQEFSLNYPAYPGTHAMAPQVYLLEVVKRCFSFFGYRVTGNVFENQYLKQKFIIGLNALDRIGPLYSLSCKLLTQHDVDDTLAAPSWEEEISNFTGAAVTYPSATPYDPGENGTHLIKLELNVGDSSGTLSIYDHLDNLLFSFTPDAYALNSVQFNATYFDSMTAAGIKFQMSAAGYCEIQPDSTIEFYAPTYTDPTQLNIWRGDFNLKYCVPDKTIADFLKAFKLYAGADFKINSITKDVEVYFIENQLDSTKYKTPKIASRERNFRTKPGAAKKYRVKWAKQDTSIIGENYKKAIFSTEQLPDPVLEEVYYVRSINAYMKAVDGSWQNIGPKSGYGEYGSGEVVDLPMTAVLCEMDKKTYDGESIICPVVNTLGISDEARDGTNSWDLIFCTYHGLQQGSVDLYPLASAFEYTLDGTSLGWIHDRADGSGDSFATIFWSRWLTHLSRNWPTEVLVLSGDPAVTVADPRTKWNVDHNDYLIQSIERELGRKENLIRFTIFKI